MDLAALSALLAAVRAREPRRRIILFGSAALLAALPMGADPALDFESTLDADILLDPDDEAMRRVLDAEFGSGSAYDLATGFHGDFVDYQISFGFFPPGWPVRLVPVLEFAGVFALSLGDNAAAKLLATAHTRLNRRMGGGAADRGAKDIQTVTSLLRKGLLAGSELERLISSVRLSPAMIVEAGAVVEEVNAAGLG